MSALATPLKRYSTVLVTMLATAVVALTMLVAAPQAQARPYHMQCNIAHHRVHRGDHDGAKCIHGMKDHDGVVYVVQKEHRRVGRPHHKHWKTVYKLYTMGRFHTDRSGAALVHFRIPRRLHFGLHQVHFKTGHKSAKDWIAVARPGH